MAAWTAFACPLCHGPLQPPAACVLTCLVHPLSFAQQEGIWRFLLPERQAYYDQFIQEYETIRRLEGRGSPDPTYYQSLPYRDLSGQMPVDWKVRSISFTAMLRSVFEPLERTTQKPLQVLDLGAGNGWLSYQLARRGHIVAAVDLASNDFDGLGCYQYYDFEYTPIQAEFDRLPIPNGSTDLVIFNASLHYSEDYRITLAEALRVMKSDGRIVVLDSPIYHQQQSGAQMVQEREIVFLEKYGFPSNALRSENYLTYQSIHDLGVVFNLDWEVLTPHYGLGWTLKPIKARLLGRREPAKFHLLAGKRL